jgi:hypothetical protein
MEDSMTDDPNLPEHRALFDAIARLPQPQPPAAMAKEFRARARAEPRIGRGWRPPLFIPIAALLVLAVGGVWWRNQIREDRRITMIEKELAAALANLPAAGRFQAISTVGDSGVTDARIVKALTTSLPADSNTSVRVAVIALTASLLTDSSTNVRVAAAAALGRIATPAALRDAAARSIRSDSSPFVQAALLNVMARLAPADRTALLRALLARPDLDPVVRAEAEARAKS